MSAAAGSLPVYRTVLRLCVLFYMLLFAEATSAVHGLNLSLVAADMREMV